MGCDIHLHYELRQADGPWKRHDWAAKYAKGVDEDGDVRYDCKARWKDVLEVGRNYDLFAVLADVRNGRGFAGIKTGEGFIPIAQPRGLPEDVTPETMADYICKVDDDHDADTLAGWVAEGCSKWITEGVSCTGPDWHSASHVTLAELQAYNWKGGTTKQGVVDLIEYVRWSRSGDASPKSWCGDVSGSSVVTVSVKEAEELIENPDSRKCDVQYYVAISWGSSTAACCDHFTEKTMPELAKLGKPEDVRLVFWFDN